MKTCNAAFLGVVALAVFAAPAIFAQTQNPNYVEVYPLEVTAYNDCAGEMIRLSGAIYVSTDFFADRSGGVHYRFHFRAKADGVGLTSGRKFALNNSANEIFNLTGTQSQFSDTFTQHWKLISQGSSDNGYLRQTLHFTINAWGDVTSFVFDENAYVCGL